MTSNLFLVAAPRSGSTQLSAWLASHPDVDLPTIKEPNFFSQHEFPADYVARHHLNDVDPARYVAQRSAKVMQFAIFRESEHYDYLFQGLAARWRMDASTTYLHCPEAAQSIRDHAPDAKVILLTRNPVARALSHYRLATRTGRTTRSLREEIQAEASGETPLPGRFLLRQSRYDDAVYRYREVFGPDNLLELTFEDLVSNVDATLAQVAAFLEIDPGQFDTAVDSQNAGDAPRFKALNAFLMTSGLKTHLRQLLPVSLKRKLKAVYFKPNTEQVSDTDKELLRQHLELG
ncbi:sulfotransferase family protein [Ruegeria lacuscaerulensis]|uniref:sulfotransferase family protein n=1 Tax=Ruegeria lacuscaerulensis TaxID=55218 RepID=UPI00147C71DE|nr:sulfotransferase [Ruegeria lacuscaerulensis]